MVEWGLDVGVCGLLFLVLKFNRGGYGVEIFMKVGDFFSYF